jgi:hypothetical protein
MYVLSKKNLLIIVNLIFLRISGRAAALKDEPPPVYRKHVKKEKL